MPNHFKSNDILQEATAVAEYMYGDVLKQFGEFSDEKWNTESKIRRAANDIIFYVAQAVGTTLPGTSEYDWSGARKNLLSLQAMYVFASKQNFIELEPNIVVRIEKLITKIDKEIDKCRKDSDRLNKKELEPWLEKYRLWKAMQDKGAKSARKPKA